MSQSFIKKPDTGPHSALAGLGVLASEQRFFIASLKHTIRDHEHITWWGPDHRGYTPVVGERIGTYTLAEAQRLNDGLDCLAVPVEAVRDLLSPEPYFKMPSALGPGRFYDQRGPVVDNSRANWNRLIAAGLEGRAYKPKPEVYRRKRRSFALPEGSPRMLSADPTAFPDQAPKGYVWAIAQAVSGPSYHSGSLLTRPELGRFYLHSEARKSIKARADAHNMTLVPVLIEDMPVVCEDDSAGSTP